MSFGWSVSDVAALAQLAWQTVQNARKACGEYDELTREVFGLHIVLRRLENEVKNPESALSRGGATCGEELEAIASGCRSIVQTLDKVLDKFNALSEEQRSGRKLVAKIRFGNGQMGDLVDLRAKITYYTSVLSLYLNMVAAGSMGRIEKQMEEAGGDLRELKTAVNSITAKLMAGSNKEGSILTSYADDDKAVWREFRRELVKDGFSSSSLKKHKVIIKAYFEELGHRGFLDEENPPDNADHQASPKIDAEIRPPMNFSRQSSSRKPSHDSPSLSEFVPEVLTQPLRPSQSKDPVSSVSSKQDSGRTHKDCNSRSSEVDRSDKIETPHVCPETSDDTAAVEAIKTPRKFTESSEQLAWSTRRKNGLISHKDIGEPSPLKHGMYLPERMFVAKPWGICIIYGIQFKVDFSTILADFEYRTQILACARRDLHSCRRLFSTNDLSWERNLRRRELLCEQSVALIVKMQCLLYFQSPDARETVLHSCSYSTTPDLEQAGFVCAWFLSRTFYMWFDFEIMSIIRDVGVWMADFDNTWGRVTSLSDTNVPTDPVIFRTERSYFQDTPLYEWGCTKNDYWEAPFEELDELYRLCYREFGIQCRNLPSENGLGRKFLPRFEELFQRVVNDEKAVLSKALGSLLNRVYIEGLRKI
ncbi:hypothetical protein IMSHALPRED_008311 [Imshaugia aleurites]|uniref:Fungal N-terminal domain-containing protein n=1 Tax=Imshaugia aleurites TaxID=172621 RepID=A0A8H3IWC2_9LECA|nr:hypothetical protein IMSHALPRED_008311 [Imshaugia aleurites]